jgi:hypothetical protein
MIARNKHKTKAERIIEIRRYDAFHPGFIAKMVGTSEKYARRVIAKAMEKGEI